MSNRHEGSAFDDFLREEGIYEEVACAALKEVISRQIEQEMAHQALSKAEMARRMGTSRSSLDRLLDPSGHSVTLSTLNKAARVLGKKVQIGLVDDAPSARQSMAG